MGDKKVLLVLRWLAGDDCGISSRCLAFTAVGMLRHLDCWDRRCPSDPADLGRCLRLLKQMPWIRQKAFPKLRRINQWEKILRHWDHLAALMEEEVGIDWRKGDNAPKTYKAMTNLRLR